MIKLSQQTFTPDEALLENCRQSFKRLMNREDLGFFHLPFRQTIWDEANRRGVEIAQNHSTLAIVGIGGSSIGVRALEEILNTPNWVRRLVFFDNVDAHHFWEKLNEMSDLKDIHWLISSKSGNTVETLTQTDFIQQYLEERGLKLSADNCTVVSENRPNPLTQWARLNDIPIQEIPLDVGGRFSVLTGVGLIPAAFLGCDLSALRIGSQWIFDHEDLIIQLMAQSVASWKRGEYVSVFWGYCDNFRWLGAWVQQLWAESLSKKLNRQNKPATRVSTPIFLLGACDQHSILQQLAEGHNDKFVFFVRSRQAEAAGPKLKQSLFGQDTLVGRKMGELLAAELKATTQALETHGVQSLTLDIGAWDEATLGAFFVLFELLIGGLGEVLDINAFNQPGVELGKRLAREYLQT